jgi:hypothetical protein
MSPPELHPTHTLDTPGVARVHQGLQHPLSRVQVTLAEGRPHQYFPLGAQNLLLCWAIRTRPAPTAIHTAPDIPMDHRILERYRIYPAPRRVLRSQEPGKSEEGVATLVLPRPDLIRRA